jgi:hypothetical protein
VGRNRSSVQTFYAGANEAQKALPIAKIPFPLQTTRPSGLDPHNFIVMASRKL